MRVPLEASTVAVWLCNVLVFMHKEWLNMLSVGRLKCLLSCVPTRRTNIYIYFFFQEMGICINYGSNLFSLSCSYVMSNGYKPSPLQLSEVKLTPGQEVLVDKLAENAHNVWAKDRIKQGWTYGIQQVNLK